MGHYESEILTTAEAAEILGYTVQHTRLLIRLKKLTAMKMGRDWLINRSDLNRILPKDNARQSPERLISAKR